MEFLYTGTLEEHTPKDWQSAFEIIRAGRFFLLEGLEFVVVDYLLQTAAEVTRDMKVTGKFLSIAVEFSDILGEKSVEIILRDLVFTLQWQILSYRLECLVESLQNLTQNAFLYFLERTKRESVKPKFVSDSEFLRVRTIILWCACKDFPPQDLEILRANQSEVASVLQHFSYAYLNSKPCQHSATFRSMKAALALSVNQFLPFVDLRRIQPFELVQYFEPMDIIPSLSMTEAFRFHALRGHFTKEYRGWETFHYDLGMYSMGRDLSSIQKIDAGVGFAFYGFEIDSRFWKNNFEWDVIIEEVCDGFIEIGLIHDDVENNYNRCIGESLSGQPGGWALRMDSRGVSVNRTSKHESCQGDPTFVALHKVKDYSDLVYGKDFAQKNSEIKVRFHMAESACSFMIDNVDLGYAWSQIQRGMLFPAVSLGRDPRVEYE